MASAGRRMPDGGITRGDDRLAHRGRRGLPCRSRLRPGAVRAVEPAVAVDRRGTTLRTVVGTGCRSQHVGGRRAETGGRGDGCSSWRHVGCSVYSGHPREQFVHPLIRLTLIRMGPILRILGVNGLFPVGDLGDFRIPPFTPSRRSRVAPGLPSPPGVRPPGVRARSLSRPSPRRRTLR